MIDLDAIRQRREAATAADTDALIAEVERQGARAEAAEAEVARLTDQRRRLVEALERVFVREIFGSLYITTDSPDLGFWSAPVPADGREIFLEWEARRKAALASGDALPAVRP